jgi:hypothetical protein
MIWRKGILVTICFLMLITVASALLPDYGTVSSSVTWPVANTVDSSVIKLQVKNLSTGTIVTDFPVTVTFAIDDPIFGYVNPNDVITEAGIATTTFKVNRTSGKVWIHAYWTYTPPGGSPQPNEVAIEQKIDHGPAYFSYTRYQSEVNVGETTPFILTLEDWYKNRVENRNPTQTHNVKFRMYFPPGGTGSGGLKNATSAYLTTLYDTTDAQGNITLTAKVDTVPGENNIWISAIENMPDPLYPYITGITQATPFYIEQAFQPDGSPPRLPADENYAFTIRYTLLDQYRNPTKNHPIQIYTSANESLGTFTTNSMGYVDRPYKHPIAESVNITAVSTENSSVYCSKIVEFYSINPVSMVFSAVPQSMGSRDVPTDPLPSGELRAKVMDGMGNPAPYELVTFSLTGYTNSTVLTQRPSFESGSYVVSKTARTDNETGIAIINFYPGEFPVTGSYYCQTASGTATVNAVWAGFSALPVTISFKNYPYLRVETSVEPEAVEANETFEVTVRMIGDGWKMTQKDIDVVLVFDKSGSMGWDTPTRLSQAKTATNAFVDQMSSRDQIGLVTFSSSAALDQQLTLDHNSVKNKIDAVTAGGSTQERLGIYTGINELKTTRARSGAVQAIILMTDGDWNTGGTPLGKGNGFPSDDSTKGNNIATWSGNYPDFTNYYYYSSLGGGTGHNQEVNVPDVASDDTIHYHNLVASYYDGAEFTRQNMSIYAKENNIRLYTISFASTLDPMTVQALQIMATNTGGFYQHAPNGAQLEQIYKMIAGDLRQYAGVNTQMSLSFQNVNVTFNNVTNSYPGNEVFEYNYTEGKSTWVTSWNNTMDPLPDHIRTTPASHPGVVPAYDGTYTTYPYSFNQMAQWQSNSLSFNAGNITVNQTWETKFLFKVLKLGNIDIFGTNSSIIFDNGAQTLQLPRTYITVVLNRTSSGINATTLDISNLRCLGSGTIKDFMPLAWEISYGGNQTVTERVSYSYDGGLTWILFDTNYIDNTVTTDYSSLDVRLLPPGLYYIRVDASAPDAPSDRETLMNPGIVVGTADRAFIKLE